MFYGELENHRDKIKFIKNDWKYLIISLYLYIYIIKNMKYTLNCHLIRTNFKNLI